MICLAVNRITARYLREHKAVTYSAPKYDIALSFAGEDRAYAESLADALKSLHVEVFYDGYEKASLWGTNLYDRLSDVYQNQAKYCVMFLSKHYAAKLWPNLERQAAQARAFRENTEYLLPLRLDDTILPGLPATVAYLDWHSETVASIATAVLKKLGRFNRSARFVFDYRGEPEPGLRRWYQIDEVKWVEQYPSGHSSVFVVVDRAIVNKNIGTIVRKVVGDAETTLVPDYKFEVFIPDRHSDQLWLAMRHQVEGEWSVWRYLSEIRYLDNQ